jgi:antitoxin component YwqK of YwqJK toxin-antitoxin module
MKIGFVPLYEYIIEIEVYDDIINDDVINPDFASYQTLNYKVISITSIITNESIDSIGYADITLDVGKTYSEVEISKTFDTQEEFDEFKEYYLEEQYTLTYHKLREVAFFDSFYGKCKLFTNGYTGKCLEYHGNGQSYIDCNYINGRFDGKYLKYHDNGKLERDCNYVNGTIEDGELLDYYDNGQIFYKCNYKNRFLDGKCIKYLKNGFIDEIKTYVNGELKGDYMRYNRNILCTHMYYENKNKCYRIK